MKSFQFIWTVNYLYKGMAISKFVFIIVRDFCFGFQMPFIIKEQWWDQLYLYRILGLSVLSKFKEDRIYNLKILISSSSLVLLINSTEMKNNPDFWLWRWLWSRGKKRRIKGNFLAWQTNCFLRDCAIFD